MLKFFLIFVQPTCFGYHQRNGRFGRNAVGVVWYIGLRMDHCLLDHLERPSFIWKGIYCISAIIFISSRNMNLNPKELLKNYFSTYLSFCRSFGLRHCFLTLSCPYYWSDLLPFQVPPLDCGR